MNILLLRHGRNDYFDDGEPGRNPGELNAAGKAFARWLVDFAPIASIRDRIAELWSFDIERCVRTLGPLATELHQPVARYDNGYAHGGETGARALCGRLIAKTDPGWAVVCVRSICLEQLDRAPAVLPGCLQMKYNYEMYMKYSGQTVVSRAFSNVETLAFDATLYHQGQRDRIQHQRWQA